MQAAKPILSVKVDPSSLKALQNQLGLIKKSLANKGMRKALTGMCRVFRDGLKREVPIRSGLLKKSITFKVWKPKKAGEYMAKVGAKNIKGAALFRNRKTGAFKVTKTGVQRNKVTKSGKFYAVNWKLNANYAASNAINPAHYLHLVDAGAKAHDIETPFPFGKRKTVKHPGVKGKHVLAKTARGYGAKANAVAVASLEQSIKEATIKGG